MSESTTENVPEDMSKCILKNAPENISERISDNMQANAPAEYEKVIDYIYSQMKNGKLVTGSRLPTERAMAAELDIGRNSIREAISILHGMGLIQRVHGSGNYVSGNVGNALHKAIMMLLALGNISRKEIYEFRRELDMAVCSTLVQKGISEELNVKLLGAVKRMNTSDMTEYSYADKEFHNTLIMATENNLWMVIMQAVMEVYSDCIDDVSGKLSESGRKKLQKCHEDIYYGIINKDENAVMAALSRHYDMTA